MVSSGLPENENIFAFPTTYLNSYRKYPIKNYTPQKNKIYNEEKLVIQKPNDFVDQETLVNYKKGSYVPFNLYHFPNDINGIQQQVELADETDSSKPSMRKPPQGMPPAVTIDDITDPKSRDLLNKFLYTTVWSAMSDTAHLPMHKRKPVKLSMEEVLSSNVTLKTEMYEPLPERYIRKSREWDDSQDRYTVDPTKMFWINKETAVSSLRENPIVNIVPQETKDTIADLLSKDKLHGAHDLKLPGYSGYTPMATDSIPLEQPKVSIHNPFLTVSQVLDIRRQDKELYKVSGE